MSVGITLEELLAWNEEASDFWKAHLDANPALLELPCGIGGTANVQGVRAPHLGSGAALGPAPGRPAAYGQGRDACRSAGCALRSAPTGRGNLPRHCSPLPSESWDETYVLDFDWVPPETRTVFAAQGRSPCAVSQPAPLGATGHPGPRGRIPLGIQGRPALQSCAALGIRQPAPV